MQRIDGRYAWNVQSVGNMRSIILNKSSNTAKQFGFYAWNARCFGIMRSIIHFQAVKVNFEANKEKP